MCGVLESGITLPMTVSHYIPFSPGRGFPPPAPQPLALWAQSSVSFLALTSSTAIPSPPCVRTGRGVGKAVVRCAASSLTVGMAGVIPSQVGRATARSSRDSAGQAPHLPPSCTVWVLMWRPQSQGLSVCGSGSRPRRRADAWLSFLTPNSAWTIVSVVGGRRSLAVGGATSGCRTGSPGTYEDLHDPASISMSKGRGIPQQKSNILASREKLQRRGKNFQCEGTIFHIFEQRSPDCYFVPDPANCAASLINRE